MRYDMTSMYTLLHLMENIMFWCELNHQAVAQAPAAAGGMTFCNINVGPGAAVDGEIATCTEAIKTNRICIPAKEMNAGDYTVLRLLTIGIQAIVIPGGAEIPIAATFQSQSVRFMIYDDVPLAPPANIPLTSGIITRLADKLVGYTGTKGDFVRGFVRAASMVNGQIQIQFDAPPGAHRRRR